MIGGRSQQKVVEKYEREEKRDEMPEVLKSQPQKMATKVSKGGHTLPRIIISANHWHTKAYNLSQQRVSLSMSRMRASMVI